MPFASSGSEAEDTGATVDDKEIVLAVPIGLPHRSQSLTVALDPLRTVSKDFSFDLLKRRFLQKKAALRSEIRTSMSSGRACKSAGLSEHVTVFP